MHSRHAIACALVAAAGSAASAGVFTWTGAISDAWNNAANWAGPGGLYPRLTVDTATVTGAQTDALLSTTTALGGLNVFDGATVYTSGNTLFIDGNANLSGGAATLTVTDSPAVRDLDVDSLRVSDAFLAMYDGLAQVDRSMLIEGQQGGAVIGTGTIEMDSTTGDLVIDNGALWAMGVASSGSTLLITKTDTSTSRLDWTSPDSQVIVWDGKTVHNTLAYTGPLGGEISVSGFNGGSRFVSDEGFIGGPTSRFAFSGDGSDPASVHAPFVDSYGDVTVTGEGRFHSQFLGLRGNGTMDTDAQLTVNAPSMLFDSFSIDATGPNTNVRFLAIDAAMLVQGGTTLFDLGESGTFDLDGSGQMEISIADGATLDIRAGSVDLGVESFGGTLNVAGVFHVEPYGWPQPAWVSTGDVNMEGGEFTGRWFMNEGTISGHGSIEPMTHNNGLVEAVGGTLSFDQFNPGGTNDAQVPGVVRAEQGDIVITKPDSQGWISSLGSMYVGNGSGPREVYEMNGGLLLWDNGVSTGLLSLNGGSARFGRVSLKAEFEATNDSLITISGSNENDALEFREGSASIDGDLEVRGHVVFWPAASMSGGGTIHAASIVKDVRFRPGSSTGDVGIVASGGVGIGGYDVTVGEASTAALELTPTATLNINIAGDTSSDAFSRIDVAGDAYLDGTMNVAWTGDDDQDPPLGETYTVLTADSVTGSFDEVDFTGLGETRRAHVSVTPTTVEVLVSCISDFDGNGLLDLSDIDAFIVAFLNNDELADIAAPFGVFDLDDIDMFVTTFQSGCAQ
ncbi:MAG: hypothetical protein AAGI53_01475 [Planctomycetota bacterium]